MIRTVLLEAKKQIRPALQQAREHVRADRKWRGLAEEIRDRDPRPLRYGHAIAGDHDELPLCDLLAETDCRLGRDVRHLQQVEPALRIQLREQRLEHLRMLRMHEHRHLHAFTPLQQPPGHLHVPEVRRDDQATTTAGDLFADHMLVVKNQLVKCGLSPPHAHLVENALGERREMPEDQPSVDVALALAEATVDVRKVLPGRGAGERMTERVVEHHGIDQHPKEPAPAELEHEEQELDARDERGLGNLGPVARLQGALQRRATSRGARTSIPRKSCTCIRVMSTLSRSIRKCDTPSGG